ncbi:MAG: flagellar basal body-associated FliL family protein [Deltaproteobacteria bacterium]|nr:flagellar basal body-associated FliL family protein [Deltaproteobacteria bacterium]
MAEKEKEELEKEDQENREESAPKRKKVPVNLIIFLILVLCLAGGGVYFWKSGVFSGDPADAALEEQGGKQEMGPIYSLDTFIVNLIGDRGKNYLKAKIELELDSEKAIIEMNKRLPQIKDSILTMLSSKSNEDINTLEGKFQLRAEIITTLNQYLKTGKVRNVYFTDFIIQ